VLRAAQRYWIQRDNQRHSFDRYFYELRQSYRAIGARFVEQGLLKAVDDIFFLGKTEIYAHLDGLLRAEHLTARAIWRHAWWDSHKGSEPPLFLKDNLPYVFDSAHEEADGSLKGMGGAPGIVTGPVRLIRSMGELGRVEEGEILVTQAIDPAWTPIFGLIGGVISEEGGILSHATVLGREYGIPVVIGVREAMVMLKDGDRVNVNGTTGVIRRQ
jgi:pyruvate,water dikinase